MSVPCLRIPCPLEWRYGLHRSDVPKIINRRGTDQIEGLEHRREVIHSTSGVRVYGSYKLVGRDVVHIDMPSGSSSEK